jgi:uncharacterized protein YkwD
MQRQFPDAAVSDKAPRTPLAARVGRSRVYRSFTRRAWLLVFLALFVGVSLFTYHSDKAGGLLHADYYIGNFLLVIWSVRVPVPLLVYGIVFALVLFIPLRLFGWGVVQVTRRRYARGILAVVFVILTAGFAVSNSPYTTVIPSSNAFYQAMAGLDIQSSGSPSSITSVTSNQPASTVNTVSITHTSPISTSTTSSITDWLANPSFADGAADITIPPDYQALAAYALSVINNDRGQNGVAPVSLGSIQSGQQHADSMLYFDYFEHNDTQGYTPFQRFEMLGGGNQLMGENQGLNYCNNDALSATELHPVSCTVTTVEHAIANSEYGMMYNDLTCCNNGHRDNILDSSYTEVSIGIAYSASTSVVYFVEDFYGPCPAGYTCG